MSDLVDLVGSERRRNWGLIMLAGGGMAMTAYAAVALYLVRDDRDYSFYLGLAAMAMIGVVLTGFAGLLVKRTIRGSVAGNEFEVSDQSGDTQ